MAQNSMRKKIFRLPDANKIYSDIHFFNSFYVRRKKFLLIFISLIQNYKSHEMESKFYSAWLVPLTFSRKHVRAE